MSHRHLRFGRSSLDVLNVASAVLIIGGLLMAAQIYRIHSINIVASEVPFTGSIRQAVDRARTEKRPILIDVYSPRKFLCTKMEMNVYSRKDVADAVEAAFIPLRLNPESSKRSKAYLAKYGITEVPTTLFINEKGEEIGRVQGYADPEEFLDELTLATSKAYSIQPPPQPGQPVETKK